jgi:tRNA pseudouridine55 synthase
MARGPRARTAPDAVVVVDKAAGMTSHDVVARLRRIVGSRKVGHAGTLDPMATGVLVLGVERATRVLGHLMTTEKQYDATIRLGIATVTDDAEGEPTACVDTAAVSDAAIVSGVRALTGAISQRPSSVSAIKVDGVRSYRRVREGEAVQLAARPVTVSAFEVGTIRRSAQGFGQVIDVEVGVTCSAGTYVRALARDLGDGLGVGGHLTALRRTRVGRYGLGLARTLEELAVTAEAGGPVGVPLVAAVQAQFGTVAVDAEWAARVRHGNPVPLEALHADELPADGVVGVVGPDGALLSLAQRRGPALWHLAVLS